MMNKRISNIKEKIKSNEFWVKLFKNSAFAFLGDSGASIINFIITIVLIKLLGDEDYGYLVLAISYMTIMDLLINLQSWKSVIHYGQDALVKKNNEKLFGYIKIGTILDVSTAILGCLVSIFLASIIGNLFGWDKTTIVCSQIMSFVIISHFSGTPTAVLRILNKFNLVAIQKITSSMIKLLALIILFLLHKNINVYVITWIYAITDIIGNFLLVIFAFFELKKKYSIKEIIKVKYPNDSKEFTKFTIWTTLSDVVDIPVQQIDVFIISQLGLTMVAIFKVFKQLTSILSKVMVPIQQAIMPQFSEMVAKGNVREAYNKFKKIHKILLLIFIPIALLVGLTSYFWLDIIFTKGYSSYWYVLLIFLVSQAISFSYSTIHPLFVSMKNVFWSFIYGLFTNILYLIVAFLLVDKLQMLGLILAYTLQYSTLVYLKNKKIKKQIGVDENEN